MGTPRTFFVYYEDIKGSWHWGSWAPGNWLLRQRHLESPPQRGDLTKLPGRGETLHLVALECPEFKHGGKKIAASPDCVLLLPGRLEAQFT